MKVDARLLIIRQLLKKDLLNIDIDDSEIKALANRLKEKTLYKWIEVDFNKITGITATDVVKALIRYEKINRFLNEITNESELSYILRNYNNLDKYNSLQEIKDDIENVDEYWIKLKETMNFSDDFIGLDKEELDDVFMREGKDNKEVMEIYDIYKKSQGS